MVTDALETATVKSAWMKYVLVMYEEMKESSPANNRAMVEEPSSKNRIRLDERISSFEPAMKELTVSSRYSTTVGGVGRTVLLPSPVMAL